MFLLITALFIGLANCIFEDLGNGQGSSSSSPTVSTPTLTISNQSSSGLSISWTKASDDVSAQSTLQYLVYYSTSNNLANIADIEANGTAIGIFASDIDQK